MRPLCSIALLVLGGLSTTPLCNAQGPVAAAPTPATTVLRTTTRLVLVDVVVTERDEPVHSLERQRFHIFEDGHEQAIASFDEHRPPNAPATGSMPTMKRVSLPPHTYTNIPDYPDAGAVTVLLLDALNTPISGQMNVRREMIEYLGKIKPGTSLAIFGLSSRLRMITGFSTDMAALAKALKSPKAGPQQSVLLETPTTPLGVDAATAAAPTLQASSTAGGASVSSIPPGTANGPMDAVAAAQQFQADTASFQTDQRVQITLDALEQLARSLSAIPNRKNVIWFSGAFPLVIDPDPSLHSEFNASRSYMEEVRETTEILSDARVAIYPVDARGLMTASAFNAANTPPVGNSYTPGTNSTPFATQVMQERTVTYHEQASMQQVARDTGGKAYIETNDLTDAVADIAEKGSSYYTIGYVPDAKKFDGEFHRFKVNLDNASYKLAYRSGYYADSPDKPSAHHPADSDLLALAAQHGVPQATQISFDARVLPASDPLFQGVKLTEGPVGNMAATLKGPARRFVVDLVLDLHGLVFETAADGSRRAYLEFALVAYDPEGNRVNYLQHGFQLAIKPDRFEKLMVSGIPIRAELDLPEGQGSLRIAIQDFAAGRTGSLEVPLTAASK
jgi:VWFA-related protein